jgi:hypothetical protein
VKIGLLGDPSVPGVPSVSGVPSLLGVSDVTGEPSVPGVCSLLGVPSEPGELVTIGFDGESTSVMTVVTVKLPDGEVSMMVWVTVSGPIVDTEVGVLLTWQFEEPAVTI